MITFTSEMMKMINEVFETKTEALSNEVFNAVKKKEKEQKKARDLYEEYYVM